jgi:putative membrane-bound dehydrogenase-like protein
MTLPRNRQFENPFMKNTLLLSFAIQVAIAAGMLGGSSASADFTDKSADPNALPNVPPEFEVSLFAREPMVRQPCSMAFDERGRLFVGMGPQYRTPKPETPGDSVVMVLDTDGDGEADRTKVFATGFNAIQGLAWHGRDLWIANAPDLTVVRDVDGDDVGDQYVKLYTDLGNLEHGLHGLNWAPDGKLYMSKGNSKGLNQPGRYAPKPFRDLWGLTVPADVPDFPAPQTFSKDNYRHAYHNPSDDWGMDGGVLRCDDGGYNLEIVSRGFRNPWDIAMDSGFNWLGTDNDQSQGDRVFVPFYGAHFGWNHPWSSHWSPDAHAPTAPVCGPLFQGSGTGVIFCMSPQFPPSYRGSFLVNDWLLKKTYLWRPKWDGATLRPERGKFTPFIEGGSSLFRPTDLEFGPDGALWVLGWSSGYGAEYENGELSNEGRIFRVAWKDAPPAKPIQTEKRLKEFSIEELIRDFDSPLPVRRINAQDELVSRGGNAIPQILAQLSKAKLTENQETWMLWALGRMREATSLAEYLHTTLRSDDTARLNRQVQAVRILSHRANRFQQTNRLADCMRLALRHAQPRVRFAAVQAIHEARQAELVPDLLHLLEVEPDAMIFYAGWQALRKISSTADRRALLTDSRAAVRRAALLALLETHELTQDDVDQLLGSEVDPKVRQVAELWTDKMKQATGPAIKGRSLSEASGMQEVEASVSPVATIRNLKSRSGKKYRIVSGGFVKGNRTYVDRDYRLTSVPPSLAGSDLIQTANGDESSTGDDWLSVEAIVPVRVCVGIDEEQESPPRWLTSNFKKEPLIASIDEGAKLVFYSRTVDAGSVTIGGNTDNGDAGSMVNYIVAVTPLPLESNESKATMKAALAMLDRGDRHRGEVLFRHSLGAGCVKCHSLDESKNGFGPNLSNIGSRSNVRHIVQSIVQPSEIITEGFNQQTVVTDEGQVYSGVLLEESGLTLSLGTSAGERIDIPKASIEERNSNPTSAMPEMAETLTPLQVADLAAFLLAMKASAASDTPSAAVDSEATNDGFQVERQRNQLLISLSGQPIVEFVFRDEKILRPYFSNARLVNGLKVTRNHPPVEGIDELDHSNLHPGIWLAFGDINGSDFWRNKAAMEHVRFVAEPTIKDEQLRFATECRLKESDGEPLCLLTNEYTLTARPNGWLLIWSAEFRADELAVFFGDQEEMGFGARIATAFTEKNGGLIRSSTGKQTAKNTWGQTATWCDYSGSGPRSGGIMLMASPDNFRESWWHNRNYGAFVSNPFGRKAMKQGEVSAISIAPGNKMRITFGAFIHDHQEFDAATEYEFFKRMATKR